VLEIDELTVRLRSEEAASEVEVAVPALETELVDGPLGCGEGEEPGAELVLAEVCVDAPVDSEVSEEADVVADEETEVRELRVTEGEDIDVDDPDVALE
jgi:hypothetical protein